jgi:hypothetical protein
LVPPGRKGFDPWCLTDPRALSILRRQRPARRQVDQLWGSDPDPKRTLALRRQIDEAMMRGDIAYEAGHLAECPWSPIFLVKRPVRIGNRRLDPLTDFTLRVGRHPSPTGLFQTFRREVITGPFR